MTMMTTKTTMKTLTKMASFVAKVIKERRRREEQYPRMQQPPPLLLLLLERTV